MLASSGTPGALTGFSGCSCICNNGTYLDFFDLTSLNSSLPPVAIMGDLKTLVTLDLLESSKNSECSGSLLMFVLTGVAAEIMHV